MLGSLPWEKWLPPYVFGPLISVGSACILIFGGPKPWWKIPIFVFGIVWGGWGTWTWFSARRNIFDPNYQRRRDSDAAFSAVSQRQSDGLTAFQHQAMSAVSNSVGPDRFKRIAITDGSGDYLEAPLGTRGSKLYIYLNEAAILGAGPHIRFEKWEYPTPSDLLEALTKECSSRAA